MHSFSSFFPRLQRVIPESQSTDMVHVFLTIFCLLLLGPDPARAHGGPEPGSWEHNQPAPTWALYDEEPILQTSTHLAQFLQFVPTKPAEVNGEVKILFLEEQRKYVRWALEEPFNAGL